MWNTYHVFYLNYKTLSRGTCDHYC